MINIYYLLNQVQRHQRLSNLYCQFGPYHYQWLLLEKYLLDILMTVGGVIAQITTVSKYLHENIFFSYKFYS